LCCRSVDEETDKRPEIVVISNQPNDKDNASIPESFGDSGVSLRGEKYNKAGSRGSVSEEDSGVGSEGHNQSDIADQTDTSSQADDCASKPGELHRSESQISFDQILTICDNHDLTAEIAEELKQMNGFSLEANSKRNILELDLANQYEDNGNQESSEKKKKRKRRKHRKVTKEQSDDQESEEVKEV
jgi:hypothetical protein